MICIVLYWIYSFILDCSFCVCYNAVMYNVPVVIVWINNLAIVLGLDFNDDWDLKTRAS